MKKHHWIGALLILFIGYAAGVMWPSVGEKLKGKVTSAA